MSKPMIVTEARHKSRCDVTGCTNMIVKYISRMTGNVGRFGMCQECIDGVSQIATVKEDNPIVVCPNCGKKCKGKMGLMAHSRKCKGRDV